MRMPLAAVLVSMVLLRAASAQECPLYAADSEVSSAALLHDAAQRDGVKVLLATDRSGPGRDPLEESFFYYENLLRPALRSLVSDPDVGAPARFVLATIAVPEDIKLIVESPPVSMRLFPNRWAYAAACSLLSPSSENEWSFLRKCAVNGYDDRWVDEGAIQTLKLIASKRSREVLEEALRQNVKRTGLITRALEYVDSHPEPLEGPNLEDLAVRVAQAVKIGNWSQNRKPRCNATGDKALVDIFYDADLDVLRYTATFHRVDSTWTLRGVSETMQMLVLRPGIVRIRR